MASKNTKKVSRIKTKKKIWFTVIAPKSFGQKELGETYLNRAEDGVGRTLQVNLRDLTGNIRDQNAQVIFRMNGVEGHSLHTDVVGFVFSPSYVKRLVRKNTARLDDYLLLESKNKEKVLAKTLVVTRHKAQRSVRTALRKKLQELLQEELKKTTFAGFVNSLVNGKLKLTLKKQLHKIMPIKEANVRVLTLLQDAQGKPVQERTEEVALQEAESEEESPEELSEESSEEEQSEESTGDGTEEIADENAADTDEA